MEGQSRCTEKIYSVIVGAFEYYSEMALVVLHHGSSMSLSIYKDVKLFENSNGDRSSIQAGLGRALLESGFTYTI